MVGGELGVAGRPGDMEVGGGPMPTELNARAGFWLLRCRRDSAAVPLWLALVLKPVSPRRRRLGLMAAKKKGERERGFTVPAKLRVPRSTWSHPSLLVHTALGVEKETSLTPNPKNGHGLSNSVINGHGLLNSVINYDRVQQSNLLLPRKQAVELPWSAYIFTGTKTRDKQGSSSSGWARVRQGGVRGASDPWSKALASNKACRRAQQHTYVAAPALLRLASQCR